MGIEGIRVLSEYIVVTTPKWVLIPIAIGALAATMWLDRANSTVSIAVCLTVCVAAIAFGLLALFGTFDITEGTRYKCVIDDDVSISEVYDSYEVVDRDGDIWILQDKDSKP